MLERALAACASDPAIADGLDELDLHSDLADVYDRTGRVEDALEQVDVLVERGYRCSPDPRCRRAEILMRHGRVSEATPIWSEVLRVALIAVYTWLDEHRGSGLGLRGRPEFVRLRCALGGVPDAPLTELAARAEELVKLPLRHRPGRC